MRSVSLPGRLRPRERLVALLCCAFATASCVPVPVSKAFFQTRAERPFAVESAASANDGLFSSPAFDASGALLAAYDSGSNRIRIVRVADLTTVDEFMPARRPRRLRFSPAGTFLAIEAHQGWVEKYLSGVAVESQPRVDSPEAIRDDIQRVEIRNLRSGQAIRDLQCDAVTVSEPQGGWLWARQKAITPGYRSSAVLEAHFSTDESELSMLCWDGTRQRWDTRTWRRLENRPPPAFWDPLLQLTTAQWLAGNDVASQSPDGRLIALRLRDKRFGFGAVYVWDEDTSEVHGLPGKCSSRLQPAYALTRDGKRIAAGCASGLGYALRAWDMGGDKELPLEDADFGMASRVPLRGEGVAMSPDGRYLVAVVNLTEALLVTPVPAPIELTRSDLRLWRLDGGQLLVSVSLDDLAVPADYFRGIDVAFSPDGELLAVAGRRLRIYRSRDLGAPSP